MDKLLCNTFPARAAGAVSGEGIAVGAVEARAVVAAVVAPPSGGTRCKEGTTKAGFFIIDQI